ncbi:MAG: hypothetical protein AAF664_02545 [Planctomycetota bacterium]
MSHLIAIAFLASWICGCSTKRDRRTELHQAFEQNDLEAATQAASQLVDHRRDGESYTLDSAMIHLASGNLEAFDEAVRGTHRDLSVRRPQSLASFSVTNTLDERFRPFRGAGYERALMPVMLSIGSLADDVVDAESYSLIGMQDHRKLQKQNEETSNLSLTSEHYATVAAVPYLRGILREATYRDYDDATKAYDEVRRARPTFQLASASLERVKSGVPCAKGKGVLHVIALVDRGPLLVETSAPTTSEIMSHASVLIQQLSNRIENDSNNEDKNKEGEEDRGGFVLSLPNIIAVKIPTVEIPQPSIATVAIRVNQTQISNTVTLEDIGELAIDYWEAETPHAITRAVVRRSVKELSVALAADRMGLEGQSRAFFHAAAVNAWAASEKADTRCWSLLPRQIQVARLELPVGEHSIGLESIGFDRLPLNTSSQTNVRIVDGRNSYLVVMARPNWIKVIRPRSRSSEQAQSGLTTSSS